MPSAHPHDHLVGIIGGELDDGRPQNPRLDARIVKIDGVPPFGTRT